MDMIKYFLEGMKIGAIVFLFIAVFSGVIAVLYTLAKNDIFITFVEESTAKAIMKFRAFHRIVMRYENCTCTRKNGWDVKLYDPTKSEKAPRKWYEKLFGGLAWVGIPGIYSVYEYTHRWMTFKPSKEEGQQIEKREKPIKHIFVKDYVYYGEIKGAETKGLLPLDIGFLITVRVMNPYKALFRIHDWMNAVTSRIEAYFRQYVPETEFDDLIKKKQEMGGDIMEFMRKTGMIGISTAENSDTTKKDGEKDKGKFLRDYGIKVKNIEMLTIDPAGENKKTIQEAATTKWVTEKQKAGIETLADAEVQRVDKVYPAILKYKEEGLTIRMLESIDKAGQKEGNWIIPFGSVQQFLQGLFGKRKE